MFVAALLVITTMIMAARLAPVPTTNGSVVRLVTPKSKPELTLLSNVTPACDTTSVAVALCDNAPLTPLIVSVYVPRGELAAAATVNVDDEVAGLVLKVLVAPVGIPATLRVTGPPNPFAGVIVIV